MTDVYGLDVWLMQPDISPDGYFDELSAMVGIDLMDLYAALQMSGRSAGVASASAESSVSDTLADVGQSDSVPSASFQLDGAPLNRNLMSGVGGDDGKEQDYKASVDGLGLWMDVLGAAVDSGDGGFGWGFDRLGAPVYGGDDGQTARQFALDASQDDWFQQSAGLAADLSGFYPDSPFVRTLSGLEAAAEGSGSSLTEALDAAAAGTLWQKAAAADSFAAFTGSASLSAAAQMSIPRMDGITGASGTDARIPPEMLWSETEDRLLDRLERRLGIEIANSAEGAFG